MRKTPGSTTWFRTEKSAILLKIRCFEEKKKMMIIWYHISWYMHIFLSNQAFWPKIFLKNFEAIPSWIFAKNGRSESYVIQKRKISYFAQNRCFWREEKMMIIWCHRSWYMHIFLSNQAFSPKIFFKNFEGIPSSKFAENGRSESLCSGGFSVPML